MSSTHTSTSITQDNTIYTEIYFAQAFPLVSPKVGHYDLLMVCDIMMYYHTKFGYPATYSIKDILQTRFLFDVL